MGAKTIKISLMENKLFTTLYFKLVRGDQEEKLFYLFFTVLPHRMSRVNVLTLFNRSFSRSSTTHWLPRKTPRRHILRRL